MPHLFAPRETLTMLCNELLPVPLLSDRRALRLVMKLLQKLKNIVFCDQGSKYNLYKSIKT